MPDNPTAGVGEQIMKKCVICGVLLDSQNKSKEHIIHNAIGGSLEDDEIYCKVCNELYGSDKDKAFTRIFAPIVDGINIHKTRKTKGTPYTGVMCDQNGNLYTATFKAGKIVKLENGNLEYVKYEEGKFKTLYHDFKLDNVAFKLGISKIAFNYAIHCGLDACCLERVFDYSKKKLIDKPIIIPFIPMTLFDAVMEMHPAERIFHAVRIFNHGNFLYAYIELFNTFQNYVVLSEKYDFAECGNIDKSYGNIIEMNEPLDKDLLEAVTPRDYKDADIIRGQYNIDIDKLLEGLKKYHNYDCLDRSEQVNMLFDCMGKKAYEQIRIQPYVKDYEKLINHHYDTIDFSNVFQVSDDTEWLSHFFQAFQFYTIFNDDCVNMEKYKKILPDGSGYPVAICKVLNSGQHLSSYGHMKFQLLMNESGTP